MVTGIIESRPENRSEIGGIVGSEMQQERLFTIGIRRRTGIRTAFVYWQHIGRRESRCDTLHRDGRQRVSVTQNIVVAQADDASVIRICEGPPGARISHADFVHLRVVRRMGIDLVISAGQGQPAWGIIIHIARDPRSRRLGERLIEIDVQAQPELQQCRAPRCSHPRIGAMVDDRRFHAVIGDRPHCIDLDIELAPHGQRFSRIILMLADTRLAHPPRRFKYVSVDNLGRVHRAEIGQDAVIILQLFEE